MAHFYVSASGNRGEATRCGSKDSGIESHTRGWNVGVEVLGHEVNGSDVFAVYATGGSAGGGRKLLGSVVLSADGTPTFLPEV